MGWRRYALELALALLAYAGLLVVSLTLFPHLAGQASRYVVILLPMVPAGALAWVVLRQLRRLDELQRRIQLEALGFAFALTALLTFAYGFLELAGLPRVSLFSVWPLMATLWVAGLVLANRHYAR